MHLFLSTLKSQLTPQRRTHHRNTKHMLPHNNIAVFINILNILSIEWKQLNEEVNERIPVDDLERSKHVGLLLIKVF